MTTESIAVVQDWRTVRDISIGDAVGRTIAALQKCKPIAPENLPPDLTAEERAGLRRQQFVDLPHNGEGISHAQHIRFAARPTRFGSRLMRGVR